MAKQSCDPFRGGFTAQASCHVRPGVAVTKGDLMARDPVHKSWAVPFNLIDTVANAYAGFLGVANASVDADQEDRRLVLNYAGKYMYQLGTAAEVCLGDYLIPVLNGGSTACEPQKWAVAAASTYAIAFATKNMPAHALYYGDVGERAAATCEADDETWTTATALTGLAVGSYVRVIFTDGTVANATTGDIVKVATLPTSTTMTLETLGGTAITCSVDVTAGYIETVQGRGTADEAEGQIISTLLTQSINAVL